MNPLAHEVAAAALQRVKSYPGVDYADVRVCTEEREQLGLRSTPFDNRPGPSGGGELALEQLAKTTSTGVGVRVLRNGAWGFAALPDPSPATAERAADQAAEIAAGVAIAQSRRVALVEEEPQVGRYTTPIEIDPFTVPLGRRIDDLRAPLEVMRPTDSASPIKSVSATAKWQRVTKLFQSTEGSQIDQTLVFGGAGIKVVAADRDGSVQRSWPLDFDGGLAAAGYEQVGRLNLGDNADRLRDEVLALLSAPPCPTGPTTLILDTPQLALQIHESCGHPTEADRALGDEVSLAGASFLTPDKLGRFTYGSPRVNLTADAKTPGGLGTFGWDDEGVPARTTPLVARGVFVGYLSSRETAATLELGRSAGCMRAESWSRPPIVRMINVSLEPDPTGPESLEALIGDTDRGILMTTNKSWSIDDLRLNFQFGCEAAWEIAKGKRRRLLRNPIYTGSTPAFWRGCDAICGPAEWRMWGFSSCGKGDPMQLMAVGHGCAPARFRGVEVGASR